MLQKCKKELEKATLRACLNFIVEIYYDAIFERTEANFAAIVGTMAKKSTKVQPKRAIRMPMNKF